MNGPTQNEWIYDWNLAAPTAITPGTRILLNDETFARRPAKSFRAGSHH